MEKCAYGYLNHFNYIQGQANYLVSGRHGECGEIHSWEIGRYDKVVFLQTTVKNAY